MQIKQDESVTLLQLVSGPSIVYVTRVVAPSPNWVILLCCTLSIWITQPCETEWSAVLSVTGSINALAAPEGHHCYWVLQSRRPQLSAHEYFLF